MSGMKTLALTLAIAAALTAPAVAQDLAQAPRSKSSAAAEKPCANQPMPAPSDVVAFAIDGDTLAVMGTKEGGGGPHIRLWGIQAPELRDKGAYGATGIETVAGMKSRAAMEDLLVMTGYKVHIEPTKWDLYCRVVARVTSEKAGELGLALIQQGMAYGFYLDDAIAGRPEVSVAYGLAEASARKQRLGLWHAWLGETK